MVRGRNAEPHHLRLKVLTCMVPALKRAAWFFYLPDNGCIRHCLAIHEQPYRIAVDMDNASALPTRPQRQQQTQRAVYNWAKNTHTTSR
jgi:hypothetical protein